MKVQIGPRDFTTTVALLGIVEPVRLAGIFRGEWLGSSESVAGISPGFNGGFNGKTNL